ncbi:probable E3 ubiquitin-protein ligase RNF217 isoform X2 [Mugil cephalus]|uniref:probable E3 ubiquitin-protein ligase RNF217 isoform X2 n=1 Tax=Mugil cephalus TaxID=48193 RepID=UPI001FB7B46A|nr:probable E3 ubiquitin-protein ligase RNF217 isoform X2 [Mugil cephalus]
MGRAKSGMEDDGPIADACKMPSFIGSFEEGRVRLSRNLPTETSSADGKVERPLRDLTRRVTRSNSRLSLDGGERSVGEEKDAEGNNNNNCNGGGRARRRRASAVEILRRNFGDSKPPSFLLNTSSRMQCGDENEAREGGDVSDVTNGSGTECGECEKSDVETGEADAENEPTPSESPTPGVRGVERLTVTDRCHSGCDGDGSADSVEDTFDAKEHVYSTVYCIANDSHRQDAEITDRHDGAGAADATDADSETGREAGGPAPYTLDDLVDPFAGMSRRSHAEEADADTEIQICWVCLDVKPIAPLPCCKNAVCDECLKLYVSSLVRVAKLQIRCPIPECTGNLEEGLVISHLATEEVAKYRYFLELSQLDSSTKPCPQCSHFTSLKTHNPNRSEHKYKIQCSNCQFVWCFKCHAPWHNGLKCRDYRKGDKLLRSWASVIEHGQRNAQKCPQCKIHIQRTEGCDHMTCTQCNTNFCYRCGERYRHLRFFGDHTSNLSVFGCKYRYLPEKPHLRRLIRGSVCGLVVFPVYYVCKRRRKKQHTRGSVRWI